MNILFLSLGHFWSIHERHIYTDLLREFTRRGHHVYLVSPIERRDKRSATVIYEENTVILKVKTGNIQKTNIIEKGISTLLINRQFQAAIKKHFSGVKFDLVLYPTPPITFTNTIKYIQKRDKAKTYLMLKDIFPQNAVDLGIMGTTGIKGLIYKYFRRKERQLYSISDYIGCMSQANVEYVLNHNSEISSDKVGICPNSIELVDKRLSEPQRNEVREKYGLPFNKRIFIYGGNLGKPQGIPFLMDCLRKASCMQDVQFLIVGSGTEYEALKKFISDEKPENVKLMKHIPKEDYDNLVAACDVGMIFLDHRFTIPNFPSRLLGYMQAGLPILACTDPNTDIGKVITRGNFGWWCESNDVAQFEAMVRDILTCNLPEYGKRAYDYLKAEYTTEVSYQAITSICKERERVGNGQ